ncbi:Wdr47 [Symbiodinium sp. KB8]|nr:Wdr47 [Symbiodinium sp. KB8]
MAKLPWTPSGPFLPNAQFSPSLGSPRTVLQATLTRLEDLCEHDVFQSLLLLLECDDVRQHADYSSWTPHKGRMHMYTHISSMRASLQEQGPTAPTCPDHVAPATMLLRAFAHAAEAQAADVPHAVSGQGAFYSPVRDRILLPAAASSAAAGPLAPGDPAWRQVGGASPALMKVKQNCPAVSYVAALAKAASPDTAAASKMSDKQKRPTTVEAAAMSTDTGVDIASGAVSELLRVQRLASHASASPASAVDREGRTAIAAALPAPEQQLPPKVPPPVAFVVDTSSGAPSHSAKPAATTSQPPVPAELPKHLPVAWEIDVAGDGAGSKAQLASASFSPPPLSSRRRNQADGARRRCARQPSTGSGRAPMRRARSKEATAQVQHRDSGTVLPHDDALLVGAEHLEGLPQADAQSPLHGDTALAAAASPPAPAPENTGNAVAAGYSTSPSGVVAALEAVLMDSHLSDDDQGADLALSPTPSPAAAAAAATAEGHDTPPRSASLPSAAASPDFPKQVPDEEVGHPQTALHSPSTAPPQHAAELAAADMVQPAPLSPEGPREAMAEARFNAKAPDHLLPWAPEPTEGTHWFPADCLEDRLPVRTAAFDGSGTFLAVGTNSKSLLIAAVPPEVWNPAQPAVDAGSGGHVTQAPSAVPAPLALTREYSPFHAGSVYCTAWSNNSGNDSSIPPGTSSTPALLATCSNDTTMHVLKWTYGEPCHVFQEGDAAGPEAVAVLRGNSGTLRSVAFLGPSTLTCAGGRDFALRLWDVASLTREAPGDLDTDSPTAVLAGHTGSVFGISRYGPAGDAAMLASCADDGTVRLWDARAGACVDTITVTTMGSPGRSVRPVAVHGVAVDHVASRGVGGKVLAAAGADGIVRIIDPRGTRSARVASSAALHAGSDSRTVAFAPCGNLLASGGFDGSIAVSSTLGGVLEPLQQLPAAHRDKVLCVAWHPWAASFVSTGADCATKLWVGYSGTADA